ncbi:MAG: class I SAM-dependent methyltransferase [Candidatus Wallbacteria bacterium]
MNKTDWDSYYNKPYKSASFTRKITQNALIEYIKKYSALKTDFTICELGGANSCFYNALASEFKPSKYIIIDNNEIGLKKFNETHNQSCPVELINENILAMNNYNKKSDVVFSVGLIEHFSESDTVLAVKSHFDLVEKNGIVIISVPTPTFLYNIIRKAAELAGMWIFHDETPIPAVSALSIFKKFGEVIDHKILWLLGLTQVMAVIKKK